MANGQLEPASTDHVTGTVVGAVVGAVAVGAAVAAAPILLPAVGLGALGAAGVAVVSAIPWLGAAVGGWWGYNRAEAKAKLHGIKR